MASRRILNYGGGTRCGKMSALSYRALFKHWHSLSVLEIIPNIYVNSSFFDFCFGKVLPLFNGASHKVLRVFNGASHDFRRMFNRCRHMISGANHKFDACSMVPSMIFDACSMVPTIKFNACSMVPAIKFVACSMVPAINIRISSFFQFRFLEVVYEASNRNSTERQIGSHGRSS